MVKEEEIITEAGERGYLDMDGLGDEDFFEWLLPSSYFSSSGVSTATTGATPAAASSPIGVSTAITGATPAAASSPIGVSTAITGATPAAASSPIGVSTATTGATLAAASSPIGVSYMNMALPYHHTPSFTGQEQYDYHHGNGPFGLQYNGGGRTIPVVAPQKSSPTTECSSSISMSSPTATSTSSTKPQAFKKKGSRCSDRRKDAPAADKNKKPRVRRESLGERIAVLQQLVSPFGKSDTATVLQDSASYIRSLHEQIQVLSSPYMQRLPASAHATVQESSAGTVVEPPQRASDLRSRGLCLVPISCTDHIAGDGHSNGANPWSVAVPAGTTTVTAAAGSKGAAAMLPGGQPRHLA